MLVLFLMVNLGNYAAQSHGYYGLEPKENHLSKVSAGKGI